MIVISELFQSINYSTDVNR